MLVTDRNRQRRHAECVELFLASSSVGRPVWGVAADSVSRPMVCYGEAGMVRAIELFTLVGSG